MNKSDLMVGNWVIYNPNKFINEEYDTPKPPYPCQIRGGEDIDLAETGCYSPIPLTPEILEKSGFTKGVEEGIYKVRVYITIEDRYIIDIDLLSGYCRFFRQKKQERMVFEGRIKFIHQLQQALRLCGIQKEIKL